MMFYIYSHIQQDTGKIFYIGKGKGTRAFCENRSKLWKNVANKHGWKVVIIKDSLSEEKAFELEKYYIKNIGRRDLGTGNLVNLTDGGEGVSGIVFTEEVRKKISNSLKGKSNGWEGKQHSQETRNKMCESRKNWEFSEESRKKMSDSAKRRKSQSLSEVHRKKLSDSAKGKQHSDETRKKMSDSAKLRCANKKSRN